ncbi:MAG: hypothetical protein U9P90_00345 [Patescibacteria group bacterium]|nr:hypothetical protein [Patescibacteria group bacterium]
MTRFAYKNKYKNKKRKVKYGIRFRFLTGLCVATLIFVGVFYLYEVNSAAVKGYKIKEIEKKVDELKEENKRLGNLQADYESMQNTNERTKTLQMVASHNIEYITVLSSGVAKR